MKTCTHSSPFPDQIGHPCSNDQILPKLSVGPPCGTGAGGWDQLTKKANSISLTAFSSSTKHSVSPRTVPCGYGGGHSHPGGDHTHWDRNHRMKVRRTLYLCIDLQGRVNVYGTFQNVVPEPFSELLPSLWRFVDLPSEESCLFSKGQTLSMEL